MKTRERGEPVWELRYYEHGERSRRRAVTVGSLRDYPTESAVRKSPKVLALLMEANTGIPQTGTVTMGALIERYEKQEMPERYSTRKSYQCFLDGYIKKRWSESPLSEVRPLAVEAWLAKIPLAPKSRTHIKAIMHVLFECALRWELIDRNPIALVRVKGGSRRLEQPRILTTAEFQRFAKELPEPYRTMVLVAGGLGLRVSEVMALRWSDFDFSRNLLSLQRAIVQGRVGEVKTEASRSVIPLADTIRDVLLAYRPVSYATPEGWLFANPSTGRPFHQEQIVKTRFPAAVKASGIGGKLGWHTFRHSYRSWLDQAGASMTVQKELMRHSDISTTMNVYGGAFGEDKRKANAKVVEMILPSTPTALQRAANGS